MEIDINFELSIILSVAIKIIVATICGGIIGWDRERKNKVAGLRTNILICVGSAIFTIGSFYTASLYGADPTRIISTIVTGMGFLGGGVIMKEGDRIIGITTAAFIWVCSAIGILAGMGMFIIPIVLTFGLLFLSYLFEKVEKNMKREDKV